jgi:hypothetical protein
MQSGRDKNVAVVVVLDRRVRKVERSVEREALFLVQVMTSCGALRAP